MVAINDSPPRKMGQLPMHSMGKQQVPDCFVTLISMHVYVPTETPKPELTEAVEEKQSQILDRLLKKSLHRNKATLQKVRSVCIIFYRCVAFSQ